MRRHLPASLLDRPYRLENSIVLPHCAVKRIIGLIGFVDRLQGVVLVRRMIAPDFVVWPYACNPGKLRPGRISEGHLGLRPKERGAGMDSRTYRE